ncbi:MAG: HDIG domain-containing protein [Patescibacteria group bacterium]|nr:HDIG domain-containing protein [Patescibacteria group bacterium]MDD5534370.1 HDIG domain-containing protein [Patescibacteria group bacterium]
MVREEAFKLVEEKIKTPNLIKHCLAVEVVMKNLAKYFFENEEKWALAGLLHDIDYEETKTDPVNHSLIGAKFLAEKGIELEIIEAIKAHNVMHGLPRQSRMAKALFCSDPITGLIVASTLVLPNKKISDLTVENILNRYKEKGFAKGANREHIAACDDLNLSQEEFFKISLEAMQGAAQEIGL